MVRSIIVLAAGVAFVVAQCATSLAGEAKAGPEKKAPDKKGAPKEKKPPKPPEPLHVWAERIHYVQGQSLAHITGPATIIKGDMRIDADTMVANLDEKTGEFKKMDATGNVRVYTVVPITQRTVGRPPLQLAPDGRSASCDRATYDETTGIVTLYSTPETQVLVGMGKDEVRADRVVHDRNKQQVTFEGRVQLTAILPVKGEEKAPPSKAEPPKEPPPAPPK
ncbi:MAG TPA: LptA/OstA family protein [Planctomycetota bacterium]|nr:LptA/OstA family protein [Planctomycetota bacterium]